MMIFTLGHQGKHMFMNECVPENSENLKDWCEKGARLNRKIHIKEPDESFK